LFEKDRNIQICSDLIGDVGSSLGWWIIYFAREYNKIWMESGCYSMLAY